MRVLSKHISSKHIHHYGAIAMIVAVALSWLHIAAQPAAGGKPDLLHGDTPADADSLTVSLITCYPGPEIYELCGHEAIRVRGEGRDSVWNFGMFNFHEPNFIYRFVKGETDYLCAGYPFEWFVPEYVERGSKIVEQDLNLSQQEARRLLSLLQVHALPENRKYRYNYVKDNCATRILDQIDKAVGSKVVYPDSMAFATFREEMRSYHRNYPWYQFGIDLALGSGIDYKISGREDMFVPVEMMNKAGGAHLADGRNLVKEERVIYEGREGAVLPPTPWYLTPVAVAWTVTFLIICLCAYSLVNRKIYTWVYSVWFMILGLGGTLLAFLVFVSSHEATSPNVLIMWLNPLQLLLGICSLMRRVRPVAMVVSCYNVVVMICMLIVWPFQKQSANPAIFPLMLSTLILSATYAINVYKISYNNNGATAKAPAANRRSSAGPRPKTKKKRTK